jgi:putative spermidine/putrescine transport system permease protein
LSKEVGERVVVSNPEVFIPFVVLFVSSLATYRRGVTTLDWTLDNYRQFFTDGITLKVFLRTVRLSVFISLACLGLGYPVGLYMRGAEPRRRLGLLFLIVSPLLTSVIVRNVAWLLILGRTGVINTALQATGLIGQPLPLMYNDFGVIVGVTHVYLAFMVLPIFASLAAINPETEESAASLGAPPLRVFWHVTLPLSLPGVVAGLTLVFILSMGIYLTPIIMGGNFVVTLPMVITDLVRNQFNWATASAFAVMLLLSVGGLLLGSRRLGRRRAHAS